MKKNIYVVLAIFVMVCFSACTNNISYRTEGKSFCYKNECNNSVIEEHTKFDENYSLAFVEFSDRGNLLNRQQYHKVINYIEEENAKNSVLVVVYAHGLKHNAANTGDIVKFRNALKKISQANKNSVVSSRKVIGVYIGWRGLSLDIPFLNNITYWDRKKVARQLGSGGVTELLVRLNKIVYQEKNITNVLAITGHSLGGAVILSAMKDILISHLVNTQKDIKNSYQPTKDFQFVCKDNVYKSKAFADSIVLLNPAVEANELLQLKLLSTEERCYSSNQPKLLHIISSSHDFATKYAFPWGQKLGVSLLTKQNDLNYKVYNGDTPRNINREKNILLYEQELDETTVGNYPPFRTHLHKGSQDIVRCHGNAGFSNNDEEGCVPKEYKNNHFPVSPFEPISVIYTKDEDFISNHADISNNYTLAYITTAIIENQNKKNKIMFKLMGNYCFKKGKFNFSICEENFQNIYRYCLDAKIECKKLLQDLKK